MASKYLQLHISVRNFEKPVVHRCKIIS